MTGFLSWFIFELQMHYCKCTTANAQLLQTNDMKQMKQVAFAT